MKGAIVALGLFLAAAPVYASVDIVNGYAVQVPSGADVHGFDGADLAAIGTIAVGGVLTHAFEGLAGPSVMATTFLGWGAWRTAKYRPESVKQGIHDRLAAKEASPTPGSITWVLGK